MHEYSLSRRTFLAASTSALFSAILPTDALHAASSAPTWEKRLRVSNAASIKLLQFTDIHFFHSALKLPKIEERKRLKTQEDIRRMIDHAKPDVLAVTGDLWHDNPEGHGAEFMQYAVAQIDSWGIPWLFTWGNHDQLDDYDVGHAAFASARNSLYGGAENEGNYVLTVEDASGRESAQLFCLNTRNTGMDDKARKFVADADNLLRNNAPMPMRLAAFHIPLRDYADCWDNGAARGIIGENVCFEQEDRAALPVLKEAGIQAVFCGHDHVNDYAGLHHGIELIYGRATGHNGYGAPEVPKGGKLFTLDAGAKNLYWESIFPDGKTWRPGDALRQDIRKPETA